MAISASTTEELLVEQQDNVVVITLNRPERLNAISREMLTELSDKMVEADKDPDVRCIVFTGAGRGFCSGLDLIDTGSTLPLIAHRELSSRMGTGVAIASFGVDHTGELLVCAFDKPDGRKGRIMRVKAGR